MIVKLNRNIAKDKIVENKYFHLSQTDKLSILEKIFPSLEETFYIEELIKDGELPELSSKTIELIKSKEYLKIPFNNDLKPIFLFELRNQLYGVTNEYLQLELNDREYQYLITGNIEEKGLCPCCQFYSIEKGEDGFCDICPVCFWENGGDGPNHITIEVAKQNYILFGAVCKQSLKYIDPEGKIKYKVHNNMYKT